MTIDKNKIDIFEQNKKAWDSMSRDESTEWSLPYRKEIIEEARKGNFSLVLTPIKPIPDGWIKTCIGKKVLCLASGGGQQGPVLAAYGADVTVFDQSVVQLSKDAFVAKRDNLLINLVQGSMMDLTVFQEESFDMVLNPVSMCFIPDCEAVFRQVYRVLKKGGTFMFGITNPIVYLFEEDATLPLTVTNRLPYMSLHGFNEEQTKAYLDSNETIEYSHSLDALIGGQIRSGFQLIDFYEDIVEGDLLSKYTGTFFATLARK